MTNDRPQNIALWNGRAWVKAAAEGTTGGKKLTRAEAARHASLVRWKKESPFAANVQERLAQIRAKRLAKGKGKGKAKGGKGKPAKDARTPQERANQNRAAISKETGMSDLEGPLVRIGAGMSSDLEPEAYDKLEAMGLIKRTSPGKASLTPAGKKWRAAADKGDAEGARAALAEGKEKAGVAGEKAKAKADKKAEREKAKAERTIARGERSKKRKAEKRPKRDAEEEGDEPDAREQERQADRAQRQKEHDEDRAQRKKDRDEDRAQRQTDRETREKERLADRAERAKERAERSKERSEAGKKKRQQDIEAEVARIAAARARKDMDMDELLPALEELKAIQAEILEIIEEDDTLSAIKAGRRNSGADQGTIDRGYAMAEELCSIFEALGATVEEEEVEGEEVEMVEGKAEGALDIVAVTEGSAIKALDGGAIGGFAVLFGTEDTPDASIHRDYFTTKTEFWLDRFGWPRPMTYHHGMDEDTTDDPIVGTWTKAVVKDEGIWLEGQLDRAHRYHGAVKELIRRGFLKLSSDSAPQWVKRERKPNGTNEVKRWPLLTASPTVTPAEPRMLGLSFKALVAELGLNDSQDNREATEEEGERSDETKAQSDRQRRLLLELDLELAMEATV